MLDTVLPQEAFGFLLVLTRLLALILVMPALGDTTIPSNIRIYMALAFALVIYPAVQNHIPAMPDNVLELFYLLAYELLLGLALALATRLTMTAVHVAGTIIAYQTGLASAQVFDPSQGTQSGLLASFLTLIATTLIFTANLHHLMILGFANSYELFPVAGAIPAEDFAGLVVYFTASSFALGVQIAGPFLVYAFVFNLSLGLINRMIPQFQVFFVGLPINVYLGFALLMVVVGSLMSFFMEHFQALLLALLG